VLTPRGAASSASLFSLDRRSHGPAARIQLTREGTEPSVDYARTEQKAAIYKGVSRAPFDVVKKPPEWTWVVFQEVEMENRGWGGMPVAEYRKKLAAKGSHPGGG